MRTPASRIASMSSTAGRSSTYPARKSYRCVVPAARARAYGMRRTSLSPAAMSALARSWIHRVASVSAGPPLGGLYLKPPSSGGLCDGVTTIPSASPDFRPRLWVRIACDSEGVGVYPSLLSMSTVTSLAASTSSALTVAGSDSACGSYPRNTGPSTPCCRRYSQIACVVATMWSSLKASRRLEPRCPEVPKETRCAATAGSGCPV